MSKHDCTAFKNELLPLQRDVLHPVGFPTCPCSGGLHSKVQIHSRQYWNKSCLLHRWGVVGGSLVAAALTMENWNTDFLKSHDWSLRRDSRENNLTDLLSQLSGGAKEIKQMSWREVKGLWTTGARGEDKIQIIKIYKSITGITVILWLNCATQQLQHERGHPQTT